MSASPPGWSADSNWFWDGLQWNDAVSPDGKWRFDGREWKAFHGQRSLMPPEPLHPAVPEPLAPAAANLPSWVAQSEVERLEQERLERERLAAQAALPQVPLPQSRTGGGSASTCSSAVPAGASSPSGRSAARAW